MKILPPERYPEYEQFVRNHPHGSFTQSIKWPSVKPNWTHKIIVSEDASGKIVGGMTMLILPNAKDGRALLYAPRGPVYDFDRFDVLADLTEGVKQLGRDYNAFVCKLDPFITADQQAYIDSYLKLGYTFQKDAKFKDTIQPRFNYMLRHLRGKTPQDLAAHFTAKTRYYTSYAPKHGVEIKMFRDSSRIDDFYSVYAQTGDRQSFALRPKSYLKNLMDALGEDARMYLCYYNDTPVSGGIAIHYAGTVSHLYGGSANAYRQLCPNDYLQWNMMQWALETGCDTYDFLGICLSPEENETLYTVYRFKKKFDGEVVEYAGEFCYLF